MSILKLLCFITVATESSQELRVLGCLLIVWVRVLVLVGMDILWYSLMTLRDLRVKLELMIRVKLSLSAFERIFVKKDLLP